MRDFFWEQIQAFSKDQRMEVARIDVVFDNRRMINLLKQRGEAIKNSDNGRVFYTEHLIHQEMLRQYNANICGLFVTFETDSAVKLAEDMCKNVNRSKFQLFGKRVQIARAKEPSNYIWENMGYSNRRQSIAFYIVMLVLGFIIFIAYNIQFQMQQSINYFDNYEKFDCSMFHNSIPDIDQEVHVS
jgi:hypothetical protein